MSPAELGHVLGAIPRLADPLVLVGSAGRDDAAVYRIADDRALVATVDFFTPIVDDPDAFGAIAAANSLSDVYAMGGRPLFALGLVGFPRDKLGTGLLEQIVASGARKLAEVAVPVVGGHSIDDAEPKFGYSIVGEVDPARMVTNDGALPGDVLFLTKPLGSGLVATAIKRGLCPPELERSAIELMTHLNRRASEAMVAAGAHSATDVTGYGLIGHLANFKVGSEIELSAVPMLTGLDRLVAADLFPGGSRRNYEEYRDQVDWGALVEPDRLLLCDAQTSGGLLVALPQEAAAGFEAALAGEPYPAVRIGRFTEDGRIRVRP